MQLALEVVVLECSFIKHNKIILGINLGVSISTSFYISLIKNSSMLHSKFQIFVSF
jgi:hypothetical protein